MEWLAIYVSIKGGFCLVEVWSPELLYLSSQLEANLLSRRAQYWLEIVPRGKVFFVWRPADFRFAFALEHSVKLHLRPNITVCYEWLPALQYGHEEQRGLTTKWQPWRSQLESLEFPTKSLIMVRSMEFLPFREQEQTKIRESANKHFLRTGN